MLKRIAVLALGAVLMFPAGSFGWGRDGHKIVARIAAKNLSAVTRSKLAAILGTTTAGVETAMADAALWPDEIDKQGTKTADWHFVDVPVTAPFAIGTLCALHNCVIDRIQEMSRRLQMNEKNFKLAQSPVPSRPMTSQELAFLIHFVGDIHQPLHSANNGDRGGNCDELATPLKHPPFDTTNLHSVWDVDEVLAVMKVRGDESKTSTALFNRFKGGEQVAQLMPVDWARESYDLAKKDIYQKLTIAAHSAQPGKCAMGIAKVKVTQPYLDGNVPDVERQLMRAGIRLSRVLNQICAGQGCKAF